ncbi:MAG: hypothetical protein ACREVL_01415 [Solimonas sp.]
MKKLLAAVLACSVTTAFAMDGATLRAPESKQHVDPGPRQALLLAANDDPEGACYHYERVTNRLLQCNQGYEGTCGSGLTFYAKFVPYGVCPQIQ